MRLPHSFAAALLVVGSGLAQPGLAQTPVVPVFVDETASSGITTSYDGDWFYMVGGGVAAFDCNDDGYADIVLPGGESKAQLYVNTSKKGGSLSFAPQPSGLELDSVSGLYPADIDSDGITDLLVLRVGENVVMRGLGACRFERANEAWGFDGGDAWTAAAALTFEKGANWPTIAVGNYIDRNEDLSPWGSCTDNWLHRPGAAGRFAAPLSLKPSFCALSMLFTDWDKSGTPSLRVSNDREYYEGGQEQMWRILPGEAPKLLTPADGWKVLRIWGMGIASYDLDGDGYPEYFLTSMADNKLQTLTAPGPKADYKDVAYAKGVTAHRPYTGDDLRPSTAWHAQFDDVNNDGLVDLFVAKGNVDQMPDFAMHDPDNLLLQGGDGKFVEAGDKAGIANNGNARGGALADFNMDGLLDLVVVNRRASAQVWRNTGMEQGGNWIELELRQAAPNVDAIGSWIEVKHGDTTMRRELTVGGGHAGGQLGWVHFGLGVDMSTSVAVVWPDGTRSEWPDLAAGGFYRLERDKPATPFNPRD